MIHNYSREDDRISILPLNEYYSELYRQLRNKKDNRKFFFTDRTILPKEQKTWFNNYLKDETQIMFAVLSKEGTFIGGCGFYFIDSKKKEAEFGRFIIDEKYRGGIGFRVVKCVLDVAKVDLGLKRIYLETVKNNMRAIRTYKKVGFMECNPNIDTLERVAMEFKL